MSWPAIPWRRASSSSSQHAIATQRSSTPSSSAHGNAPCSTASAWLLPSRRRSTPSTLVVEEPRRERPDAGLDLRDVEVDAASGTAAVVEPRGERGRDVPRGERIGDRAVGADGLAVGPAGERVVARERGALAAEPGVVLVRAGLAVQACADHHEVGLVLGERVVVEAEALHRARREVLGDRVRPLGDESSVRAPRLRAA